MRSASTLFLNQTAIASLLRLDDYIEAVERAFAAHGRGESLATGLLHIDSHGGEFHVKSSGLELGRTYVGVKVNGAFWENRERGLPYVHGGILLFDGGTDSLLVLGPDGALLNHHRKLMPTYTERMVWGAGDVEGLRAVDTPAGRVGGLVCWEHWMPLARQALHESGEDVHVAARVGAASGARVRPGAVGPAGGGARSSGRTGATSSSRSTTSRGCWWPSWTSAGRGRRA